MHRNWQARQVRFFNKSKPKAVDYTTKNVVVADFGGRWTPEQALLATLEVKDNLESVAVVYRFKNGMLGSFVSNQSSAELHFKGGILMNRALDIGV